MTLINLDKKFSDILIHVKEVDPITKEITGLRGIFPITRYKNILNAPHVSTHIGITTHAEYQLYAQETVDIPDDDVFKIIGESW